MECDTKKGVIGLSQKSEKKATNLLEQLNKSFMQDFQRGHKQGPKYKQRSEHGHHSSRAAT